jgi:hypothetical protein
MTAPQGMGARARWSAAGIARILLWVLLPLPALAEDELRIRGRLLDEKGAPVAHTAVFAVCAGALPEGPRIDCGFPGTRGRQVKSDEHGRFSLEKLPPAVYSLFSVIEAQGPGRKVEAEVTLSLSLRKNEDGLELHLKRPGSTSSKDEPPPVSSDGKKLRSISGKVMDLSGAPIPKAHVRARMEGIWTEHGGEHEGGGTYTDELGNFVLKRLFDGDFKLVVSSRGFVTGKRVVRSGDEQVTFQLKRSGVVRGRAVMPDGSPVAELSSDCREGIKSRLPDGRFEEFNFHDGNEMILCLSAPGMSHIRRTLILPPEQVIDLGEIRMEPARLLKVQVIEKASGKPIRRATARVADVPHPTSTFGTAADGWTVLKNTPDMELDLEVKADGFLATRVHVRKGQTEVQVALDPGVVLTGRALDENGKPQLGMVVAQCPKGGNAQSPLDPEGGFRLQGLSEGFCTVDLKVASPPMPTFEHTRWLWVDRKQPLHLEFQYPAVRHPIHIRFQGAGKPRHALLFVGDIPAQVDLAPLALQIPIYTQSWLPEASGYRIGIREEEGFRFENLGAGTYTLVVALPEGAFRAPLTVGAEEQNFSVAIPPKLIPPPPR